MAIPVARVHLKVAHAALPALLPAPPMWNMLPLLRTSCAAAIRPKSPLAKRSRADADERWDARKTKAATSATSSPRSTSSDSIRSCAGRGSSSRKSATSPPPPKPGRADSVERWDAHKKAATLASPASSSSSSSASGTSSLASSSKWPKPISRATATSDERWDVHKKRCCPPQAEPLDDGESSSNDDIGTEEEIVWKPRGMYAGPGFVVAAPEPAKLPMPTTFLAVRVA